MEAHGEDFRAESNGADISEHLKHNWREADISAADQALCAWAEKTTLNLQEVGNADIDALRDTGLSDIAISDAAQVIGYFNYINRIAEGLGVDLEEGMPTRK
mgnify:CR=1 FL=1